MKDFAIFLIAALCLPCVANGADQWHAFVKLPHNSKSKVEGAVGSALGPLGFQRDTASAKQHPINLLRDLVAMYEAGTYADASIFEASGSNCFYIVVENFDEARTGLVKASKVAVQRSLRDSFGKSVAFFSDTQCTHAL